MRVDLTSCRKVKGELTIGKILWILQLWFKISNEIFIHERFFFNFIYFYSTTNVYNSNRYTYIFKLWTVYMNEWCKATPFPVVFIQNRFFFYLKFCFGTVVKIIVKFGLKNKIKRYGALYTHSLVWNKIQTFLLFFFLLVAIILFIFRNAVVF